MAFHLEYCQVTVSMRGVLSSRSGGMMKLMKSFIEFLENF